MNCRVLIAISLGLFSSLSAAETDAAFSIIADFPGSNIKVVEQSGGRFVLAPDLRDTQEGRWWFYWNFKLHGPAGATATLVFPGRDPIGTRGPALSVDGGKSWSWMGLNAIRTEAHGEETARIFDITLPRTNAKSVTEIQLAFCIPHTHANLTSWLEKNSSSPWLKKEALTSSAKGRTVPLLRLGKLTNPDGVILITARHHACETMGSYVLEGFMTEVLRVFAQANPDAWKRWQLIAVPFMDRDGVEDGDQGKTRFPHDHNRDYTDQPRYAEVAALQQLQGTLPAPLLAALDLHCPWIRGGSHEHIHLVGSPVGTMERAQEKFLATLIRRNASGLPLRTDDLLRAGQDWNTSEFKPTFSHWMHATHSNARLVSTVEFPYATVRGQTVTPENARVFGRDLARTVEEFLHSHPPSQP